MDKKLLNIICKKAGKNEADVVFAIGSSIDNYIVTFSDTSTYMAGNIIQKTPMDKKLLKQYKSTFHFGASVRYDFILIRGYGKDDIKWNDNLNSCQSHKEWKQKQVPTRTGIVVGWRWLSNGIGYDSEDGNSYTATESVFAIEIKRGMMNKVDLVLPESLIATKEMEINTRIPDRIPTMSDKYRKWLRDEMKSVPRDSKGRWI